MVSPSQVRMWIKGYLWHLPLAYQQPKEMSNSRWFINASFMVAMVNEWLMVDGWWLQIVINGNYWNVLDCKL